MRNKNYLTLKWGTLKSWNFSSSTAGIRLLKEYEKIGSSYGRMSQKDTPRQKEIICELIDLCEGNKILLEWDGKYVSREKAKDYVMNYGIEQRTAAPSANDKE